MRKTPSRREEPHDEEDVVRQNHPIEYWEHMADSMKDDRKVTK